jgi:hypothetical protein
VHRARRPSRSGSAEVRRVEDAAFSSHELQSFMVDPVFGYMLGYSFGLI